MKEQLRISFITLFFFYSLNLFGQYYIQGTVVDSDKIVLQQVSIILMESDNSTIIDYTFTNKNGSYKLELNSIGLFNLKYSHLGYGTKIIQLEVNEIQKYYYVDIILQEKDLYLDEIIIQAERPITIRNDTVNIKARYFVSGTEQTVEDLLRKIPGLHIDSEGTIKVGNQEIEKLMIDGDDLFERGYRLLTKNMPAYPIEEVEVLNNYSNNPLLKGIEESNKVALNLKLNEKSKRIWFGNIETNIGNERFYKLRGNLMNYGKKNKYYFFTNLNNIGYNATGDIENLIRPFRINEPASIGDNQKVDLLLNLSADNLNFKKNRSNFNNAELITLNGIFNPTKKLKIKTIGFINWDETVFIRYKMDEVNVIGSNFINNEVYELFNNKSIAFGRLDFTYNISKSKMLEATTKINSGDFYDGSNLLFNSNSTIENLQHQNSLVDQKIAYTSKFKDDKVLLLTARFIREETPQKYHVNQFFYQDLFSEAENVNEVKQYYQNQMHFAGINAHLIDKKENCDLLEVILGNEFRIDKLSSKFLLLNDKTALEQPLGYQNQAIFHENDLYLKNKYRYIINDFAFVMRLDFHQFHNRLENYGNYESQNSFYVNPSFGFDWKINRKNRISSYYSYNTSTSEILDVYNDFILTGFRSFSKGTGKLNQLSASSIVINYQLGNWTERFFANTFVLFNLNHDYYSTNTALSQNFTQATKILIKDREILSINSKLDYYFKFISSNLKIDISYAMMESKNIVNDSNLREVNSKNFNYGIELRSGFKGIFNYHLGTKWTTAEMVTSISNSFTNNLSFIDLSFVFNKKFDIQIQSELHYFGNLQDNNIYYFLDLDARYRIIKNKLILGIIGKNLLNTKEYREFAFSDIGSTTTEFILIPRYLLLRMEYRF